jgi:hypothetical protein
VRPPVWRFCRFVVGFPRWLLGNSAPAATVEGMPQMTAAPVETSDEPVADRPVANLPAPLPLRFLLFRRPQDRGEWALAVFGAMFYYSVVAASVLGVWWLAGRLS